MDRDVRTWDTVAVPASEQFAFWRDVVCEAFVPLAPARKDAGPFAGRLTARRRGPMVVTRIQAQAVTAHRTPELVRRRAGDVAYLNLQTGSKGVVRQGGRFASQLKGDLIVLDSTQPFELEFTDRWSQICIAIPVDVLASRVAAWSELTAVSIPSESGLGTLIANQIDCLARRDLSIDREAASHIAGELAGLVALAIGRAPSRPSLSSRAILRQAAVDAVERRLGEPGLAPSDLANHLHISVRYLHDLFADQGVTVMQWVLRRRLELCHAALIEPAYRHLTIAEISRHYGFADRTYFARAYRARYGLSPSAHRRSITLSREGTSAGP